MLSSDKSTRSISMDRKRNTPASSDGEFTQKHIYQVRGFWPTVVFLASLATHCYYIVEIADHPFFNCPLVDSRTYHVQAVSILRRGWLGDSVFWQAPLYPYFLAFWYHLISVKFFDIRVIQAFIAASNAVLLYFLGMRRVGQRASIGAALAVAFYGPLVHFDTEMLAPVLVVFFYLLMAMALDRAIGGGGSCWWLVAGLLNGLAALAHGLALLIAPLVVIYVALLWRSEPRPSPKQRVLAAGLFAIGAAATIAPVTVRNRIVGKQWVLISHNGPINFYIGNHPQYEKMVGLRPGLEWATLAKQLNQRGVRTVGEEARHWIRETFRNAIGQPLAVGRVWLKKLRLFFNADEIKRNYPIYPMREHSLLMRLLLWKWRGPAGLIGLGFPFGVILPLAAVGWWALRRRSVRLVAIELIMVGHFAANMLFFICSRYRVPLAPFFVLYAACAIEWAASQRIWQKEAFLRQWRVIGVALAIFLVANAFLTPMDNPTDQGEYKFYKGLVAHLHEKNPAKALKYYQAALRDDPDLTEAHFLLGVLYQDQLKEPARALEQFNWVLERDPGNMPVMFNKALSLASLGRRDQARRILETLVENDPRNERYREMLERLSQKPTGGQSENRTQRPPQAQAARP